MLLPLYSSTADHSDQLTIDFMQLNHDDYDQSPEGFMKRLKETEAAQSAPAKKQKFRLFCGQYKNDLEKYLLPQVQSAMQTNGYGDYYDYFVALAASNLSDKLKIESQFVMIPYFKELQLQPFEKKETAYETFFYRSTNNLYSLDRLLLAALFRIGVDLNFLCASRSPLNRTLFNDDISLLQMVLDYGADPNTKNSLRSCCSISAAQLLLRYGADFKSQHQEQDLIKNLCRCPAYDNKLLPLFLSHVTLESTNQFGQEWILHLALCADDYRYAGFSERLSVFLRHGCYYEQKDQETIIKSIDKIEKFSSAEQEKQQRKQEIIKLFEQDKKRRTNIIVGLQNRVITGKSLARNTNLSACYNHILDIEKQKKKDDPIDRLLYGNHDKERAWAITPKIG